MVAAKVEEKIEDAIRLYDDVNIDAIISMHALWTVLLSLKIREWQFKEDSIKSMIQVQIENLIEICSVNGFKNSEEGTFGKNRPMF